MTSNSVKFSYLDSLLQRLQQEHLYRSLKSSKVSGSHIIINNKKLLNLSSNDYLGLPPTKIDRFQFQSSSRLISGNDELYCALEKKLSRHKYQEAALVYPTGYLANLGLISAITSKNDLILSDKLNHASIIDGCRLSGAHVKTYEHNDIHDLERKIKQKGKTKFVITEGIFSMDGDFSKLTEIIKITEENNAILILDDAHGDFVVGKDGKGTGSHFNVLKKIDVYVSSLSKGLGSFGGYVVSNKKVISMCINKARSFIYTSALPNSIVMHALTRLDSDRETHRKRLERNVRLFTKGIQRFHPDLNPASHIVPLLIGSEKKTLEFGKYLFKKGIFAQPIRYPTVEKNKGRIRISITAWLNKTQIEYCLDSLEIGMKRFNLI